MILLELDVIKASYTPEVYKVETSEGTRVNKIAFESFAEKLKASRKEVLVGDIFAIKPTENDYVFGRVILSHVRLSDLFGKPSSFVGYLVYIYKPLAKAITDIPKLRKELLLIPTTNCR